MKWKTSISSVNNGEEIVRGEKLHDLIKEKTFTETIFLLFRKKFPSAKESALLNAVLNSMIDHGPGVASAMTARVVESAGNNLHTAVAAGMLALGGTRHGGALEGAAQFFQENKDVADLTALLKQLKEKKVRIPGFGHKVLSHDKRADVLFDIARENGFYGEHCKFAQKVHEELNKISSKPLPINMDGANAAVLSDMGFDWRIANGFFIVGRAPGLIAHVYEEMMSGEGIRRIDENDIEYTAD